MKWKARLKEIERLKKRRGAGWKNPLPDLSVEQRTAPLGNQFAPIHGAKKSLPPDAKIFPSATLHKQGPIMLTPAMVKQEMQYVGGKKV